MLTETTTIDFRGIVLDVEYEYSKYVPARMYENNGDPGSPEEGGDVYILSIFHHDEDIRILFDDDMEAELTNILIPYINF